MTEVVFYTGVSDPGGFAVRLCEKALGAGHRIRVAPSDESARRDLSRRLWSDVPLSFLPHCRMDEPLASQTPIWLDASPTHLGEARDADVLINLTTEPPSYFGRFLRVIEIVGEDSDAVEAGRARFKFYKERGYPLTHHNMQAKVS